MCLAIPVRIVRIEGETAIGEVNGVEREVSLIMTPEAKVGDYVIVHAGFAIQILDRQAAEETRQLFDRMAQAVEERRRQAGKRTG
ncbi:MAG: HypC/HybG/HupF family hydrogenase formation chaperone [candidate division WOR-3 bacterium]|uniref:HypC/HybG/HupF family hydrogenase formation chaperone n=1 Tax=candidate division WOR-3 bacterium TaxID=2052148 RepID=A0A7C1ND51_UNCW3|nr:HypC/HybG/HupF family hydrogenase formation chaperone [candidate division WOR-3 bacterium]